MEIQEPILCGDFASFHFHPALTSMLGPTLIRYQVVEVRQPREKRLLASPWMMKPFQQNPQSARRNNSPGEQISRWFLRLAENLSASNYPGAAFHHEELAVNSVMGLIQQGRGLYLLYLSM